MAHKKETPRQKMIGMMYLVLTAMLALNVSISVLDAFKIIDEGLSKTLETLDKKSNDTYEKLLTQYEINKVKVEPWYKKATIVKQSADSLVKYIQDLKLLVLKEAEQKNFDSIVNKEKNDIVDRDAVKNVTDYDTPARIMIGEELTENSKATILKKKIIAYRELLLSMVPPENVLLRESIEKSLDTRSPKEIKGKAKSPEENTWEYHKFGHSPLMGFMAIMSGLQVNIKNAESEVINYLYSMIDEGAFKFNELEAVVIPNTNYVLRGNKYVAQVFIAARDTTKPPTVYVTESSNPYLIEKDSTGAIVYKRRPDLNYRVLPVDPKTGKAIYEVVGTSLGTREWGGIVEITNPFGNVIARPFKVSYQVAESNAVVSPTKMNVFYLGVDNPVEISVPGIPDDRIDARISNGTIIKRGKEWIVSPARVGMATVTVRAKIDDNWRDIGSKDFRVKTVPDPVAMVANKKGGLIDKNVLLAQTGVAAVMENFDFDLTFKVTSFKVSVVIQGFFREAPSAGNMFTEEQKNLIRAVPRGAPVYIEEIKAVGPDGSVRNLGTLSFKLN